MSNRYYGKRRRKYLSLREAGREVKCMLEQIYEIGGDIDEIWETLEEDSLFAKITNFFYMHAERKLSKMHPEAREDLLNKLTLNGKTFYSRLELIKNSFGMKDLTFILSQKKWDVT
ncbi:MAG: hypothetical protein QXS38_02445 [Candidatus Pacearchaeota archaeon]